MSIVAREVYSTRELNSMFGSHALWEALATAGPYRPYTCELGPSKYYTRSLRWETDASISLNQQSAKFINYRDWDRGGQICTMRAGKFFKALYKEVDIDRLDEKYRFEEEELNLLGEIFSTKWKNYVEEMTGKYHLVINKDFKPLYDSDCHAGRIASCMNDGDQYGFYNEAVEAKATSIRDENDLIVARCILFPKVHEIGSKKIWRYAERQYAIKPHLKVALINALIKEGMIDCYKRWDANCSDSRAIVGVDGTDLQKKIFWIQCELYDGDTMSYQDTFKYYSQSDIRAYNDGSYGEYCLDSTDASFYTEDCDDYDDEDE